MREACDSGTDPHLVAVWRRGPEVGWRAPEPINDLQSRAGAILHEHAYTSAECVHRLTEAPPGEDSHEPGLGLPASFSSHVLYQERRAVMAPHSRPSPPHTEVPGVASHIIVCEAWALMSAVIGHT